MATLTLTPTPHQVFNEYDRFGLLLGLPRLEEERNAEYKQRLFDVFVNRASSTYRGLINGITRELGLSLFDSILIEPIRNLDGTTLATNPAIVFKDTKCYVYSDVTTNPIATLDRFERYSGAWTISELASKIEATGFFTVTVLGSSENKRSMCIFNQSTVGLVTSEDVDKAGAKIKLEQSDLIPNSIVLRSNNLVDRVTSQALLRKPGQYYIDASLGILFATEAPAAGSVIRYKYRNDSYTAKASPVIIHNLQSDDFKTKMFEQIAEDVNGLPTELGAEIINELLSVFPTAFGR